MNDFDLDRELRRALRDTPEEASPGFTARVMRRMEEEPSTSWTRWYLRPAFAAALLLAVGFLAGSMIDFGRGAPEATMEAAVDVPTNLTHTDPGRDDPREQLRREYQALQEELAQIRELADEQTPVLYLGGDDSFDLVYELADYRGGGTANDVRPASFPDRG